MRETLRQAARATVHLALGVGLACLSYAFVTVLLITAIVTVAVVGAALLPETILLIRRMAGAKRSMVAAWTGREIPEAYLPITGSIKERLRTSVRDPATYVDLRWMLAYYVYGALGCLALPLWPAGLLVDGVWCGLLGRRPVVLPLISRLADLDAAWSAVLLRPSPRSRLAERVAQLTQTRAGAIAAHSAELRRIERDLHDGAQARLVALSMRIGLVKRAYDSDPASVRKLLDEAQADNQGLNYVAFYPTESCLVKMLYRAGFPFVYRFQRLPDDEQFTTTPRRKRSRTFLAASKVALKAPNLVLAEEPIHSTSDPWTTKLSSTRIFWTMSIFRLQGFVARLVKPLRRSVNPASSSDSQAE